MCCRACRAALGSLLPSRPQGSAARLSTAAPDPLALAASLQYGCDLERLPSHLRDKWIQLGPDAETLQYLREAHRAQSGFVGNTCKGVLRKFFNVFDVNGMLGGCPMYVAGTAQFASLLHPAYEGPKGRLLDVGAGDGDVTAKLAPLFAEVHCTETSWSMAATLRRKGYRCLSLDLADDSAPAQDEEGPYDVVSVLNVLDRCDRPVSLLQGAHARLKDGGVLLIALVLPYAPCVYRGNSMAAPSERMPLPRSGFEATVSALCDRVLHPLGFDVIHLARCPYLSAGDLVEKMYTLDDALVVCRKVQ